MIDENENSPPASDQGEGGNGGHGGQHGHQVTIEVDGKKHRVEGKTWVVRDLKTATGVDPAKVLAEITPTGLVDLDDNAQIKIREGQRFMSHVRSGASS